MTVLTNPWNPVSNGDPRARRFSKESCYHRSVTALEVTAISDRYLECTPEHKGKHKRGSLGWHVENVGESWEK